MILELEAIFNVENSEKSFDYGFDIDDEGLTLRSECRTESETTRVSFPCRQRLAIPIPLGVPNVQNP